MALHWDTTNCPAGPWPGESGSDEEWNILQTLIWASIGIDLGVIHESNVEEWLYRLRFCDRILNEKMYAHIKPEHLRRWIGLSMNVADVSRAKFQTRWVKYIAQNVQANVVAELKESEVPA